MFSQPRTVLAAALLWLSGLPAAANAQAVTVEVVPAITDAYVLPDRQPRPDAPDELYLLAAPGEYEPASFVVYAVEPVAELQVQPTRLRHAVSGHTLAAALDVRVVKRWYQSSFGARADKDLRYLTPELLLYDDGLVRTEGRDNWVRLTSGQYVRTSEPAMNRVRLITPPEDFPVRDAKTLQPVQLAASDNRQFWVTLHVPAATPAGRYRAALRVLAGAEEVARVPVTVDVLPVELQPPALDVAIYYRGYLDPRRPEGSISAEAKSRSQLLAELKNMAAHGVRSPVVYQPYASGLLDEVLELWQQAGLTGERFFYLGVNVVDNDAGVIKPRLQREVEATLETLQPFGFTDVYFYARDEAYEDALAYQRPFWDAVRAAGGKIMAAGWQTSETRLGNFDVTGGNEDLFVALGTLRAEEAARWHAKDRLIYSYQNPTGGFEIPETYRRNYGLLLWQKGFDGAMPYAYQDSEGRAWHDFDSYNNRDLTFTYPTLDQPIDTLQWEGFREAVDDLRYLNTLQQLLPDATGAAADRARQWLVNLRGSVIARLDLDAVRREMVTHILAVQGAAPLEPVPAGARAGRAVAEWPDPAKDPGLLGWWTFDDVVDGVASDRSRWQRAAELKGDAEWLTEPPGAGVRLNGAGDIVAISDIDIPQNGTATIEGWFRFDSFAMDQRTNQGVFTGLYQHAASNYFYFARTNDFFFVSDRLEKGVWHHLALTYAGDAATAIFYVDGEPVPVTIQGSAEAVPAISGLSVGRSSSYLGRFLGGAKGTFNGAVDDLRVWSRVLAPDEVRAAWRAGRFRADSSQGD
ncbi:MAG: LamG domain-containing protein [Gammaproteobacteria bacterium]|nr:LamG domain-containing protein [Gammaproteobacteria bacterium]